MGFWTTAWSAAKSVGKGIAQVFIGITAVLVLAVYAIGYVLFTIVEHLYDWIDGLFESPKTADSTGATMVDPDETEKFIKSLDKSSTTFPPYTPGTKRSLIFAHDKNGKVLKAQIASTTKGFEQQIEEAFKKGNLVEQPISTSN